MSVESIGLSEEQRRIVNENIRGLCRPASCQAPSLGCPIGELINNNLPLCYANEKKRAELEEGIKHKAERGDIEREEIAPILTFLDEARITTKEELGDLQSSQLTIRQIMERKAQGEK